MTKAGTAHPKIADRYILKEPLGRGGMGVVWRAEDTLLRREVAVKEIEFPRALGTKGADAVKRRSMREARSAAALSHPNVVTIYDVIQDEAGAFIVMEFIDAPTLADVIQRDGPMTPKATARVGLAVLEALDVAHRNGIVHRDVKPANVMMAAGAVKLADFGIATVKDDPKITSTGLVLGSPQFMAPEQAEGATSGPPADLWSLGTTLYYAVEGAYPFDRGEPIPTLAAVVHDPPHPPQQAGPLQPLLEEMLRKDPDLRPGIERLRTLLLAIAEENGQPVAPPAPARVERTVQPAPVQVEKSAPRPRRIPPRVIVAAVLTCVLVAVALIAINVIGNEDTPESGDDVPTAEQPEENRPAAPANWQSYRNPEIGFRVSFPPNWEVVPIDESMIDLRDPDNGTYLRVDWTDTPGDSPEAAWEDLATSFAASHDDYNEIRIDPTTFKGFDAAAWEFTYSEGGASLHAIDLGFVTGEYGMALNFQTRAENWDDSQDLWANLKAGFRPPE